MPPASTLRIFYFIMHKALICGDRNYRSEYALVIKRVVRRLVKKHGTKNLLLIEGGAPGVDSMVKVAGHLANVHVAEVDALWKTRHNSAGPQRNTIMAKLEPDEVIGIHVNFDESTGTVDMLEKAEKLGIPTTRIRVKKTKKECDVMGKRQRCHDCKQYEGLAGFDKNGRCPECAKKAKAPTK